MKKALITGITGQDGSYLAEFLLEKQYEVHGLVRRSSISNTGRIDHLIQKGAITLHDGDLSDQSSIVRVLNIVQPDEIYNLAAQSHVQVSFDAPEYSGDVDALGVLRILEAIRILDLAEKTRFYQASTSELYGKVEEIPQNEDTPFHPYSPYAVAKQYGYWITREYREAYKIFAANGILFNHESERRGENFVTRKITLAAGRIACGLQEKLQTLLSPKDAMKTDTFKVNRGRPKKKPKLSGPPHSYVISVSLGTGCYRHIQIAGDAALFELHGAILDAFGFVDDHAHAFFMDNISWSDYDCYYVDGIESYYRTTDRYTLDQADLHTGMKFKYIFDFGDEWTFQCKVLRIAAEACPRPVILKTKGDAPKQYGDQDDDGWDD